MMKAMTPDDGYDTDAAPPLLPPPVVTAVLEVVPPAWAWGSLLPAAGYGRCYACRRPWWACVPREVDYDAPDGRANGHFALCTLCWDRADVEYRVIAHRWAVVMACPNWSPDELTRIEIMVRGISEFDTY